VLGTNVIDVVYCGGAESVGAVTVMLVSLGIDDDSAWELSTTVQATQQHAIHMLEYTTRRICIDSMLTCGPFGGRAIVEMN
jgi:hypothetical protein